MLPQPLLTWFMDVVVKADSPDEQRCWACLWPVRKTSEAREQREARPPGGLRVTQVSGAGPPSLSPSAVPVLHSRAGAQRWELRFISSQARSTSRRRKLTSRVGYLCLESDGTWAAGGNGSVFVPLMLQKDPAGLQSWGWLPLRACCFGLPSSEFICKPVHKEAQFLVGKCAFRFWMS